MSKYKYNVTVEVDDEHPGLICSSSIPDGKT